VVRRRSVGGLLSAALWVLGVVAAFGQSRPPAELLSDENVRHYIGLALANLGRAKCANEQFCAPATPAELANPPITLDEARAVIHRGTVSGVARACDLEWVNRSFVPMMSYWRHSQRKTERQMALIGLLHGIAQGEVSTAMSAKSCDAELRRKLDAQLSQAQKS
jgi:hypothetical protein